MAGQIVVTFNGGEVGRFRLDKESMVIGRKAENDIHLDNLAVSGKHARIITILDDSFVEDLDSTNGTFVNGKRITKQPLKEGDEITVGKHVLRFSAGEAAAAAPEDDGREEFAETIILSAGDNQALKQAASEADVDRARQAVAREGGAPAATGGGGARIRLIGADGPGKEMALTKPLTTLGKPGVQVAAINRRQNGDFIVHVEGGPDDARPVINGTAISANSQKLANEDVIEIAGVKIQYLAG